MKKWFFSNDPTHDDYANQTHINSNLANRNKYEIPIHCQYSLSEFKFRA